MAQKSNSLEKFWKELKRRKVVHVIMVYAATAFVILELVSMVARPLKLPEWTEAFVIVLLCIGFLIAVLLSWIYDITPTGVRKTKPVSQLKQVDHSTHAASNGWKIATYLSVVIIVSLIAFNFLNKRNLNEDISKLVKSIAVLPFINESPDSTNQYFCNGMMDEILTQLQKIGNLQVKSRISGERYRNPNKDIKEIGKEIGVSFIVGGSVRKINDDLRITAQLINTKTGNNLWADNYDGKYTDRIFEFQRDVAIKVASSLNTVLTAEEKQLIEKNPTISIPAYDLYLKANKYLKDYEKVRDLDSYQNAIAFYKAALTIDPSFARAYTGLANAHNVRYQWETYFEKNYLDSMLVLIDNALLIDNQLDEAFYLKGIYYRQTGEPDKALNNFDLALKYNPNYFEAYLARGDILTWYSGDFIKCIDNYTTALKLCHRDMRPPLLRALGFAYLNIGFPDKAKRSYDEAYSIDSSDIDRLVELASFAFYSGNIEEGLNIQRKTVEADSIFFPAELMMAGDKEEGYLLAKRLNEYKKRRGELNLQVSHRIGYAYHRVRKYEKAKTYFDQQIRLSEESIRLNRMLSRWNAAQYDLAATYAFIGETGKAYKYLEEFSKKNDLSLWWILMLKYDPLFNKIRSEPEFQNIVKDMEAKSQAEHERVKKWLLEQGML